MKVKFILLVSRSVVILKVENLKCWIDPRIFEVL